MKHRTLPEILSDAAAFETCTGINALCNSFALSANDLQLHSLHPRYYQFKVAKHDGGLREIEAPAFDLKIIQQQLNYLLQAVYFKHQTASSYGYIITPAHTKSKKNILGNAKKHLGHKFMLKADFQDFFHQIKTIDVISIFSGNILHFDERSSNILARICTYNERLPMGAPTSPVLSNLYTIDADKSLEKWAVQNEVSYTRFVDDLTFSSVSKSFTQNHLDEISEICRLHNLKLNEAKSKILGDNDVKEVTGLVLNQTVDIPLSFYQHLEKDIERLHHIYEASVLTRQTENNTVLQKFKQEVQGQVNFIGMVEGYHSPVFNKYKLMTKEALEVEEEFLSMRWTNFSYI